MKHVYHFCADDNTGIGTFSRTDRVVEMEKKVCSLEDYLAVKAIIKRKFNLRAKFTITSLSYLGSTEE